MSFKKYLIGGTIKLTWVSSGTTPSNINAAVYNSDELLVSSDSMVDSGNGHYYLFHNIPNTPGFYSVKTTADVTSGSFKNNTNYQAVIGDV